MEGTKQFKVSIGGQDLVIDGYLYHLEDYQLDGIREALTKSGIESSQIDIIGGHAVKILTEEYTFLVIGPVLILMSVGAYVLSKRLFGSQSDQ